MVVRMILIIMSVSLGYSGLAAQGGGSPPPDRLMIRLRSLTGLWPA